MTWLFHVGWFISYYERQVVDRVSGSGEWSVGVLTPPLIPNTHPNTPHQQNKCTYRSCRLKLAMFSYVVTPGCVPVLMACCSAGSPKESHPCFASRGSSVVVWLGGFD